MTTGGRIGVAGALLVLGACARGPNPLLQPAVVPASDFTRRIDAYVALHRRAAAALPARKPTEEPALVVERRKALAAAIRAARSGARQGTIFTPEIDREYRRIIHAEIKARDADDRAAVRKEVPRLPFAVDDEYPEGQPLATVPAMLLARLPRLPEELQYRFFDRHLILLDVDANLIVDYIPDALPATPS